MIPSEKRSREETRQATEKNAFADIELVGKVLGSVDICGVIAASGLDLLSLYRLHLVCKRLHVVLKNNRHLRLARDVKTINVGVERTHIEQGWAIAAHQRGLVHTVKKGSIPCFVYFMQLAITVHTRHHRVNFVAAEHNPEHFEALANCIQYFWNTMVVVAGKAAKRRHASIVYEIRRICKEWTGYDISEYVCGVVGCVASASACAANWSVVDSCLLELHAWNRWPVAHRYVLRMVQDGLVLGGHCDKAETHGVFALAPEEIVNRSLIEAAARSGNVRLLDRLCKIVARSGTDYSIEVSDLVDAISDGHVEMLKYVFSIPVPMLGPTGEFEVHTIHEKWAVVLDVCRVRFEHEKTKNREKWISGIRWAFAEAGKYTDTAPYAHLFAHMLISE